jgi:MFS family permease
MIEILLDQDPTPWFSERTGIMIGAFGGAGIGLLGGAIGVAGSLLVPKGKGRGLVLGMLMAGVVCGIICLIAGITALILGQAYAVWYPLTMLGVVPTAVMGGLLPAMRKRYAEAEQRRMDADDLRRL